MNHHLFSDDTFRVLWNRLVILAKHDYSDLDPEALASETIQRVLAANSPIANDKLFEYSRSTLKHLAYSKLRTRIRITSLQHDPIQQTDCTGFSSLQIEELRLCIQGLKPKLRIVLELHLNELSNKEIAVQLGLSSSAVRARLAKAKETLKRLLTE